MPSQDRDAPNNDRELVRHRPTHSDSSRSLVPMWDSSDPERAPPPLPLNPRSMSPATRHGVSPNIQAVAAKFTDKPSENAPSSYTTNPMPNKAGSPERSLVKGHHHKRLQSLQPNDTKGDARSDFLNYLENRSPERPLRATIIDPTNMPLDAGKVFGSPPRPAEREMPSYVSGRYLSKPILGESTPPSATMLALQNMQLPSDNDPPSPSKPPKMITAAKFEEPKHTMDTLASQICSLTDIASNLQREMSNLSRRSKDNATDLISLKAATNARDEDIRKSLKDLSSNLTSKYFDGDLSRLDLSAFLKPESGPNPTESDSSPNSKRSYSVPRMPSPNPFAFDRDICGSPAPISDGSASIALLEKVLREMATKEGEERLLELVDEIKSRPATTPSDKDADKKITNMLEEILNLVKEDPSSRALVRSMTTENLRPPTDSNNGGLRSTSLGSIDETATVRALDVPKDDKLQRSAPNNDEVLAILRTVKSSVVEGGGMTNNVKALVRELRGEVLGMGRDLARKLEALESNIAEGAQQQPQIEAPNADQISAIIHESLGDLQEQLAATVNESRSQASAFSQFQSTMNSAEIYSIVKKALDELEFPQPQKEPDGPRMEKDDILDTVRDAWETYKPEIELQTIGLERDEILECLAEGLKSYQPQHEQAITYEQVVAAVQTGMQNFTPPPVEQPPAITRDEIILTIRECLEKPEDTSRALEDTHASSLVSMRDDILQAVSQKLEPHSRGLQDEHVNYFNSIRDELLHAVAERPESTSRGLDEEHLHHLGSIRDEILQAMSQRPESTTRSLDDEHIHYLNSMRDELLQAIAERSESTDAIRDEILHAISERTESSRSLDDEHIHYLNSMRDELLQAIAERPESATRSLDDEQIHYLNSIRDDILHAMAEKSLQSVESTAPRSVNEEQFEHLNSLRDEILDAVTRSMTTQSMVSKESFDSGLGRDDIVSAISDGLEAHFTSAKEMDEPRVSREDVVNAINDAFNAQQSALATSPQPAISREEIMDAIVDGIEIANQAKETAISTNVQPSSSISREEILEAISEGLEKTYESQKSSLSTEVQQPSITREEVFTAIVDGFENANTMTREIELNKDDLMEAITTGLHEATNSANINVGDQVLERLQDVVDGMKEEFKQYSAANGKDTEQVLDAVKDGLAVVRQEIESYVATAQEVSGKHEIIDTVKEGFRLLQADMEKTITDTAVSNATPSSPDTTELLDAMEKEFEHLRGSISNLLLDSHRASDKDEILDAIRDASEQHKNKSTDEQILNSIKEEFEKMRESTAMSVVRSEPPPSEKEDIIAALREHFDALREETNTRSADEEILRSIKEEFEKLRESTAMSVVPSEASTEKEDIIAALREHFDALREENMQQNTKSADEQILNSIKEEFEKFRESTALSVVRSEPPPSEKEDIIAALREHFDALREETMQHKDGGENSGSATSELLDAFNDGILLIRDDVQKVLDKPADFDSSEILDTIKDGMAELRLEIDSLRQSQKEETETDVVETTRGGEVVLANEPSALGTDIEGLKTLITQLTDKMESIETTRAAEPVEDPTAEPTEPALNRSHLDEVLMTLQEVQLAIGELKPTEPAEPPLNRAHLDEVMVALQEVQLALGEMSASREIPEGGARKEDTDTIEGLLMGTKAQIEEIQFPSLDEVATSEHIGTLEAMIRESKDAIADLSTRLEAEGSTKSDIGTLEGLIKDVWVALEELKGKTKGEEETEGDEGEENGKLLKSDLQTVEAMIFEVKSQIDELKLPDVETLPTKEEIQELSALVTDFRDKMENANDLTAQGFEARKTEHGGLAIKIDEKIDEAKFVVGELGDELKSKLDGSSEGLMELKQLLEGLAISAENFTTVENVKELTDLINREFERARGEEDAGRLEKEERDAAALVKHDETRAAVIVELGAKIDEKIGEVIAKYEEAHTSLHSKFSETEERDLAHAEAVTSTKSLAEDIRLVIGAMGTTVTEACERTTEETKALAVKVDESYNRMEEMHNEAKSHQEQSRGENERVVAATERVESKLLEFNPQILETVQQILTVVSQHFDHSQKSAEEVKSELMSLPTAIPSMLPALPPPESSREIEDDPVHNKLNDLLAHAKNSPVQDVLNTLLEHSKSTQLHEKLDRALEHGAASNSDIYEKLNQILDHTTNGTGSIHEKLDALLSRPVTTVDPEQSVTQMMKLDEMHKDIMENTRKMNEMFAVQSTLVAEETERKRREAEEAAIALERRIAQREQVEADIVGLQEEKESLLKMFQTLKAEKDELAKQTSKMSKELSGLETALEIRHEEMQQMEERADGLEKRILEGVLDHARSILLSRSGSLNSMNLKRNQSTRSSRAGARSPSMASITTTSTAREPKDARSLLGNGVGMALKRRTGNSLQPGPAAVQPNIGKERRILSLSHVTGNRDAGRQSGPNGGITSLKRSHSVKSNFSARKTSWAGPTANKENEAFPEEEEPESEPETDAGTERKSSYAGTNRQSSYAGTNRQSSYTGTDRKLSYAETCTDSMVTGVTDSVISEDRRTSGMSSATGEHEESELASDDDEDDAQTAREDDDDDVNSDEENEESEGHQDDVDDRLSDTASAMEAEVLKLLEPPPDSGLGSEMTVS
ncbi:uncharacterized protein N7484_003877 [Penicillium longicatenatum]|uniref:uncharacterized protein n=1 Tax=Penicillium longicatenatum TaxID=1561947 RepID=UPI002547E681|nr:uncharacterized protein N7484_003877 [Penicillium longicatenatum]KAJ5650154.1 hypothetical protein N7484_003877 [Penicillium longicatenatum]